MQIDIETQGKRGIFTDNFGLKLALEGEKEFKNALSEINRNFKVLGSEMKLAASEFDKNEKSVRSLTSRNEVLNKQIDEQKNKVSTLESALKNSADNFGENDRRTQEWTVQLNNAKAQLNGMERELSNNNKALEEAGGEMDDTAKSTGGLGKEMDETGKKTSVFGDVLKANLAADAIKAGLSALIDTIKSVGSAVRDYVSDSSEMANAAAENEMKLARVIRGFFDYISMGIKRSDYLKGGETD